MRTCSVKGCNKKHHGLGLCRKHYRKKNKERASLQARKYYNEHKEEIKQYCKKYAQDNKGEIAKKKKIYKQKNKDKVKQWYLNNKETYAKYYQNNKEKIKEYGIQWRIKNPNYSKSRKEQNKQYYQTLAGRTSNKACCANRRLLTKDLTKEIVQQVYENNIKKHGVLTCCLCFKSIEFGKDSLEHLTPLIRGGTNDYDNLDISHLKCNMKKGTKTLKEWQDEK
jgi:hypothetical protein